MRLFLESCLAKLLLMKGGCGTLINEVMLLYKRSSTSGSLVRMFGSDGGKVYWAQKISLKLFEICCLHILIFIFGTLRFSLIIGNNGKCFVWMLPSLMNLVYHFSYLETFDFLIVFSGLSCLFSFSVLILL